MHICLIRIHNLMSIIGYFDVEERYVYCTPERFVIDPEEAVKLIDENTIGICAILGSTFNGEYEYVAPTPKWKSWPCLTYFDRDVKGINDLLVKENINVPIHGES